MFTGKEPISYKWASWGQWSSCSKTCGGKGTIQRTRSCIPPKWGGNECPSDKQVDTKDCNTDPCPGEYECTVTLYHTISLKVNNCSITNISNI